MKRLFAAILVLLFAIVGCRSSDDLSRPETQQQFGVRMARMNLWREAMFRFQRTVEINPQDAEARNNLAVAYEAVGDFDAAAKEYREALRLDRSNEQIQKNYSRFVEFTQKGKSQKPPAAAAATPSTAGEAAASQPSEPPTSAATPPAEPVTPPQPVVDPGAPATAPPVPPTAEPQPVQPPAAPSEPQTPPPPPAPAPGGER